MDVIHFAKMKTMLHAITGMLKAIDPFALVGVALLVFMMTMLFVS